MERLAGRRRVNGRLAVVGLLGSTAVAGLLFAPVFGLVPLLLPVFVVVLVGCGCVELGRLRPRSAAFRPVLVLVGGVLALIEVVLFPTTVAGLPTAESLGVVWRGLTEGWLLTLQSTWPARPDPEQLLFVPLAVLLATVLGIEILLRLRRPAAALLPGLAVAGLAQIYQASTGLWALLAAAAYAAPAALVLWVDRPDGTRRDTARRLSDVDIRPAVATVAAVVVCAVAVGGFDPFDREPFRAKDDQAAPVRPQRIGSPLHDIAGRLNDPEREVFRYRADSRVDRWSLVVLDGFDGVNWSAGSRLRRLGAHRDGPSGTGRTADVRVADLAGPWLPSQPRPLQVDGLAPLVDESTGTLLLDPPGASRDYRLTWSEPEVDPASLGVSPIDTRAGGLAGLGVVPPEIGKLARDAVRGLRPTFQSALQLDRFLRENYRLTTDGELPTGHGWPQLRRFLTETKRGTSEQFAAAYVVLARVNGIPARLVVGYRGGTRSGDSYVVRNRDVLAWPEVAVAGVGWVPLDPTSGAAAASDEQPDSLAKAAEEARRQLPPEHELRPPEQPRKDPVETPTAWVDLDQVAVVAAVTLSALLIVWLVGVPVTKTLRTRRRRRKTGADGVKAAWAEVCDRLRAHGVPFRIGMTPRDLARSARTVTGEQTSDPITRLGRVLDMALWSGLNVSDGSVRKAWDEERALRRILATRARATRLKAGLDPRPLFSPRPRRQKAEQKS